MDELIIFLSPGEKLKQARYELDITQEQLSCEKLSRRAISTIESGMRKLNYSTANIIVERIKELQKQLRQALDYDFTVDYLMEDIETQVTKEIEHIIERLSNQKNKKICDELIKRAEIINKDYTVSDDLMIKVNNFAIDFYLKSYNLDNALYFTNKNLKLFYARKDELNAFLMQYYQTRIYYNQEDYKSVISVSRIVDLNDKMKNQIEYQYICYNTASSYCSLNDLQKSIEWIERINIDKFPINKKPYVVNLIGAILIKQKEYEKAEEKYNLIVKESRENCFYDWEANSYSSIAEIYRLKKDNDKALKYINKALEINIENYTILMNVNRNALLVNLMCNLDDNIKKYFEEAFKYATILKRKKVQFQLLNIYLRYCCKNNYDKEVVYILSLLKKEEYNDLDTGVLSLTAKAFLAKNEDIFNTGIEFITKNAEMIIQ